jgi:hypothetical protein
MKALTWQGKNTVEVGTCQRARKIFRHKQQLTQPSSRCPQTHRRRRSRRHSQDHWFHRLWV